MINDGTLKKRKQPHRFKVGHPQWGGRKRGVLPSRPTMIREAALEAAILEGWDGQGKDGLVGFMRRLCNADISKFASILQSIMPLQLEQQMNVNVVYETVEQVQQEMERRGLTREALLELADMTIEHDEILVGGDDAKSSNGAG